MADLCHEAIYSSAVDPALDIGELSTANVEVLIRLIESEIVKETNGSRYGAPAGNEGAFELLREHANLETFAPNMLFVQSDIIIK